jgi:hypothetical protein
MQVESYWQYTHHIFLVFSKLCFRASFIFSNSHSNFYICIIPLYKNTILHSNILLWTVFGYFSTLSLLQNRMLSSCFFFYTFVYTSKRFLVHTQKRHCWVLRLLHPMSLIGSINWFPEPLHQFPLSSTLCESSCTATSSPTHVAYFYNT